MRLHRLRVVAPAALAAASLLCCVSADPIDARDPFDAGSEADTEADVDLVDVIPDADGGAEDVAPDTLDPDDVTDAAPDTALDIGADTPNDTAPDVSRDIALDTPNDTPAPDADAGEDTGPVTCSDTAPCPEGFACVADLCAPLVCVPDEALCVSSTLLQRCDATGTAPDELDCAARPGCTDDTCLCDGTTCARIGACTPNEAVCVGQTVERCLPSGERATVVETCDTDAGFTCDGGVCRCPDGLLRCDGRCVDPLIDEDHCRECGRACSGAEVCIEGDCICPPGLDVCGDACIDTRTSTSHCGECGNRCNADQSCVEGACACPEGEIACGPECVDARADDANCGACGRTCGDGQSCIDSACVCDTAGLDQCDDACVNTSTDPRYCGDCDTACTADQRCVGGACECTGGLDTCPTGCVDLDNDIANCGVCGRDCGDGTCVAGSCVAPPCECPPVLFGYCRQGEGSCSDPSGCCVAFSVGGCDLAGLLGTACDET